MAMAWSRQGVGHAVQDVVVRDPVVVTAAMPRFLAPGTDRGCLIELAHVEGPSGEVRCRSGRPVGTRPWMRARQHGAASGRGRRGQVLVPVEALSVGDDELTITLTTPDGKDRFQDPDPAGALQRAACGRRSVFPLAPGARDSRSGGLLSDLVPGTGSLLVSVSGAGALDVPGLVRALDRFPFGCAEQLTSRALPLLYLDDGRLVRRSRAGREVAERVRDAIAGVLAKQSSSGGFGLWGPAAATSGSTPT